MTLIAEKNKVFAFRKRFNPVKSDISDTFNKVLPSEVRVECSVLGAMLLDGNAVSFVRELLHPNSFYASKNEAVYTAILAVYDNYTKVDLMSVTEYLLKNTDLLEQVGSPYYLVELTHTVASAANVETHARIIAQRHIQRELIKVCHLTIDEAFDGIDVFDAYELAKDRLFAITNEYLENTTKSLGSLLAPALDAIEKAAMQTSDGGLTGVPSGFMAIDKITGGWQSSDLIVLAARPGMGKTSFTLGVALNAALEFKKPVAFWSLEMSNLQLVNRLISMLAHVPSERLRNGKLKDHEWSQLNAIIDKVSGLSLFIDDTPGISIFELRAKARRLKMSNDIQLIIIDYLQLMTGDGSYGNREQEISAISRQLKGLAKELNIPIIALSQLSRAVETRGGAKRPQLSDLRESGAIEQDADIVSFLYRPEYYGIEQDENGASLKGVAELIFAKHRNGALDTAKLRWDGQFAQFSDIDDKPNTSGYSASNFIDELGY